MRAAFEELLLANRHFLNQVGRAKGSGVRGVRTLQKLYRTLLDALLDGLDEPGVTGRIESDPDLSIFREITERERTGGQDFSRGAKNATFIRQAIDGAVRCKICGARLHFKSMTMDHIRRRADGGLGDSDNAQLTHPYCNSGYKERAVARASRGAP